MYVIQKIDLNKEQAEFIKELRTVQNYSWGAISREFNKKYPEFGYTGESQLEGCDLMVHAMDFLGEINWDDDDELSW